MSKKDWSVGKIELSPNEEFMHINCSRPLYFSLLSICLRDGKTLDELVSDIICAELKRCKAGGKNEKAKSKRHKNKR